MSDDLDRWVAHLAAAPADRGLTGLEAQIGTAIRSRRAERQRARALAPVGVAAVCVGLAMGITAGSAAAMSVLLRPNPYAALANSAPLAPSTLLEASR